jgi:hypothetical protein
VCRNVVDGEQHLVSERLEECSGLPMPAVETEVEHRTWQGRGMEHLICHHGAADGRSGPGRSDIRGLPAVKPRRSPRGMP